MITSRRREIEGQIGNPKKIKSMSDLAKDGMKVGISASGCLLEATDDIATKAGLTGQIRRNTTEC